MFLPDQDSAACRAPGFSLPEERGAVVPFGEQATQELHPAGRTSFWGNLLINHDSWRLNCYHDRHDSPVDGFLLDRHSMPAGSSHSLVGRTARPHGGRSPFARGAYQRSLEAYQGIDVKDEALTAQQRRWILFRPIGQPVAFLECHSQQPDQGP